MSKFLVYMPESTRKALRIQALQEGRSATKLVESLIDAYLVSKRAKRKREQP